MTSPEAAMRLLKTAQLLRLDGRSDLLEGTERLLEQALHAVEYPSRQNHGRGRAPRTRRVVAADVFSDRSTTVDHRYN